MKIFLDDLRQAPDGWQLVTTAQDATAKLAAGGVTHLSLDHDLGDSDVVGTGYDVLLWLEEQVATRGFMPPEHIAVHSANSGARPKMEAAITSIRRFVEERPSMTDDRKPSESDTKKARLAEHARRDAERREEESTTFTLEPGPTAKPRSPATTPAQAAERHLQERKARDADERLLLKNIRRRHRQLAALFDRYDNHWGYEDLIYRFYHHSYKVYRLQEATVSIVAALQALVPERPLNESFMQIATQGTGIVFDLEHNEHWDQVTRPIVEAFFHAKYFLDMAVRYGRELKGLRNPPKLLPSGWAGLLYLYDLR